MGYTVTLYEAKPYLGGILRDIEFGGQRYFNGCQYLRTEHAWLNALPDQLQERLYRFEHYYGSHTDLAGAPVTHMDFEAPVFDISDAELAEVSGAQPGPTLEDRMRCLPPRIAGAMLGWLKRFGRDPGGIDAANGHNLQLSRLYLRGADEAVATLKAESPFVDSLLGLPRSTRNEGRPIGSLPADGYDPFFSLLEQVLAEEGISVRTGQPVVPRFEDGKAFLKVRGEVLSPDLILWAANPIPVLMAAGLGRLDDPFVDMSVSVGSISGPDLPADPHYIQVYSASSPITRIFTYHLGGRRCVTIEHMPGDEDATALTANAKEICRPFYGEVGIDIAGRQSQRRHIFFTPRDRAMFEQFRDLCRTTYPNFLDGAWEVYARDPKINAIASSIRERVPALTA